MIEMRILPILFNTEMVRALLEEQKTVTRRVVKVRFRDGEAGYNIITNAHTGEFCYLEIYDEWETEVRRLGAPYQPGDILYVRETWCPYDKDHVIDGKKYAYGADATGFSEPVRKAFGYKWRPSIHMPREAARIFLKVKAVRAERLQDITEEQARAEGAKPAFEYNTMDGPVITFDEDGYFYYGYKALWNHLYAKPMPVREQGKVVRYESYPWENIQETKTYRGKPWLVIGNPWLWVIEFARTDKPDGWPDMEEAAR